MSKKKGKDLKEWSKDELVKLAVSYGLEPNRFWSIKKLIDSIEAAKAAQKSGLPPEVKTATSAMEKEVAETPAKTEKPPLTMPQLKRYLVTWKGSPSSFAFSPLQHLPALSFQRGVEVDLYEAYLAEIGTARKDREALAKIFAAEAGPIFEAQTKNPSSAFKVRIALGPIVVKTKEGRYGNKLDELIDVLDGPMDKVMAYVRKMKEGTINPLIKGEPTGNVEQDRRENVSLTIGMLYNLEREGNRSRKTLEQWLFDEQRELMGFNRLYTDLQEEQA